MSGNREVDEDENIQAPSPHSILADSHSNSQKKPTTTMTTTSIQDININVEQIKEREKGKEKQANELQQQIDVETRQKEEKIEQKEEDKNEETISIDISDIETESTNEDAEDVTSQNNRFESNDNTKDDENDQQIKAISNEEAWKKCVDDLSSEYSYLRVFLNSTTIHWGNKKLIIDVNKSTKSLVESVIPELETNLEHIKRDKIKVELAEKAIDKDNSPTIDYSNPDEVFKAMIVDNGEILNLKTELELAIKY